MDPLDFLDSQATYLGFTYDQIELYGAILAIAVMAFTLIRFIFRKKGERWRVRYSRKWLKNFRKNASKYSRGQQLEYIQKIEHFVFEEILLSCFEERGYRIQRTRYTNDGGVDGTTFLNGNRVIIQAKRYSVPIGKQDVRKFIKLVNHGFRRKRGLFIHTSTASKPIRALVRAEDRIEFICPENHLFDLLYGNEFSVMNIPIRAAK